MREVKIELRTEKFSWGLRIFRAFTYCFFGSCLVASYHHTSILRENYRVSRTLLTHSEYQTLRTGAAVLCTRSSAPLPGTFKDESSPLSTYIRILHDPSSFFVYFVANHRHYWTWSLEYTLHIPCGEWQQFYCVSWGFRRWVNHSVNQSWVGERHWLPRSATL